MSRPQLQRAATALQEKVQLPIAEQNFFDILMDVIGGVENALRGRCPRTMAGVSECWFSGHFRQVFFKYQCITPH
jgi:hypothetical protein